MTRLGLLIPSSNVVMEPLAARQPDVQVHVNRLPVLDVPLDPASQAQFALDGQVAAAKLLCDANVDKIVWGGTSASWLEFVHDTVFAKRVTAETGVPTTTTVLQINEELSQRRIKRIGMVTPYTADVARQINRNYDAEGFEVSAWRNYGGSMSHDFAAIPKSVIKTMICEVAKSDVEAIIVMCTNVAAADLSDELSQTLGRPVIDSALSSFRK
ncbi:maleate isomerase [Ruegeria halocynthiae]|uniref:Maleate isomerase n=1 Tax=Ruegeria halocynthiae TaxID=985054 RepID=A0A1H3D6U5_9RHOB|nr:hypothetical protein [Ruegeria halocynthiae]SDX62105.1 maleate isomerase [Ruegeria halocynthiae]